MERSKRSKRLICLVMVFLMVATLLVGCGQAEQVSNTPPAATEASSGSSEPVSEPYVINAYILNPPQKDIEQVTAEINKILQSKINATIKINMFGFDSYTDKVNLAIGYRNLSTFALQQTG